MPDEIINNPQSDEIEIRKLEVRAGVKKVVYGTMIVGVAATFFPFAQHAATELAAYLTQTNAEVREAQEGRRVFLESIAAEGRDPKLSVRIILAEYYAHLAEEPDRTQWGLLLDRLEEQQRVLWAAEQARAVVAANKSSTPEELARTTATATQLRDSADPGLNGGKAVPSNFEGHLGSLESDDSSIRRSARTALAGIGLPLVRPAMSVLTEPGISYRTRLGLGVALTEFMRGNKHSRRDIISLLTENDLTVLMYAAADADRTVRIYASEFLYDLGDPRIFDQIGTVWKDTSLSDAKYNLALVMKGAAPFVASPQVPLVQTQMRRYLGEVGSKTDKLLNEGLALLSE